jgi:hypothetical protein
MTPCLLTAPTDESIPPADLREIADPGYLEDLAVEEAVGAGGGGAWNTDHGGNLIYNGTVCFGGGYTYGNNYYTTGTSTSVTYYPGTVGGHATVGGSGTWTSGDWVYLGAADTTVHFYEPSNTFRDEPVDQPWTQQQATREWLEAEQRAWLHAERTWVNGWLRAERDWQATERNRRRDAAKAKAKALLISLLPEPEQERYSLHGYFEVIGSHGGHYLVRRGVAGNISWLGTDGGIGGDLCCHPNTFDGVGQLPEEDVMLGQLLALQTDEAAFVHTANGRKPPHLDGSNGSGNRARVAVGV